MVCDIFRKLGATCKAGTKSGECPQKKAKKAKKAAVDPGFNAAKLIGIEQPFEYDEVVAITGSDFIRNLHHEDIVVKPYEELKNEFISKKAALSQGLPAQKRSMEQPALMDVLVIDDEVAVNNNIRKILAKKGFHVDQALSKVEALEKINTGTYKLVLLDLKIPEVKGLELLQTLRKKNPATKVIIITGYASIETAIESARLGAIDYLPKPFTPDEVRSATDRAFLLAA
jgi:CheY-like chemotaxis protein